MAAGLAGGSTDAAAVLRGLNKFWNANLSILLELIVVANFVVKRLNGHVQRIPKAAQRPMAMPLS